MERTELTLYREQFDKIDQQIHDLNTSLAREFNQVKENVLKNVLYQLLGREATNEDAKKCTLIRHVRWADGVEELVYDGLILGKIEVNFGYDPEYKCSIAFTPKREYQ